MRNANVIGPAACVNGAPDVFAGTHKKLALELGHVSAPEGLLARFGKETRLSGNARFQHRREYTKPESENQGVRVN
jgi:hypothetical protein